MMRSCKNRRVFKLGVICFALWASVIMYLYSDLGQSLEVFWDEMTGSTQSKIWMRHLMQPRTSDRHDQLVDLLHPNKQQLQFFDLPKRHFGTSFTEITSANRDTSYPLAPDFTFHLRYGEQSVDIYEDHGPGCVYR